MISEKQRKNLINLSCEDLDIILQDIVKEGLGIISVDEYYELINHTKCKKTIYNQIKSGKLKGINISGLQFIYMNWK